MSTLGPGQRGRQNTYPIHIDVLNAAVATLVQSKPAGFSCLWHFRKGVRCIPAMLPDIATVAGACVTILKALFDETLVIPNPAAPYADGPSLAPYTCPDAASLAVGGELNDWGETSTAKPAAKFNKFTQPREFQRAN